MTRLSWMQFWPVDWLGEPGLRVSSLAARGCWIDLLCLMWRSERPGYLVHNGQPMDVQHVCRLIGADQGEVREAMRELAEHRVPGIDADGTWYSRRMVRDIREREMARSRARRQRRRDVTPDVTQDVTPLVTQDVTGREEERREEKTRAGDDGVPSSDTSPKMLNAVLTYPVRGTAKEWVLTEGVLAQLAACYPYVDVLGEARKALAWCTAHPDRRKTARGMHRFLVSWLNRVADQQPRVSSSGPAVSPRLPVAAREDR